MGYIIPKYCCSCSVTKSCLTLCNPIECTRSGFPVLHYLPEFAQTQWCHLTISSSVISSCPQSFSASGSFQMNQFFASGGQSIGTTASVQFSSVTQSSPTLCDPMYGSTPGLPVHHQHLESTQIHVHWVSDAIQPSHPLLSPSPPALNLSQHQGLFKWVSSSHQVSGGQSIGVSA